MKEGICIKCGSENVYVDSTNRHGINIPVRNMMIHPTHLHICVDCGYMEFYAQTGFDLQTVKEKFRKVKN